MKLTVGMATYDDYNGVYFSVQSLRLYGKELIDEIIVVDNNPDSEQGKLTRDFAAKAKIRYVAFPQPVGTTAPRQKIFEEAASDFVMVIDSHVLLELQGLLALREDMAKGLIGEDIYSGPLLMDDGEGIQTHFGDKWRREMRGVWRRAWVSPEGLLIDVESTITGECRFRTVMGNEEYTPKFQMEYQGHEKLLKMNGFRTPDRPFEIPGQGLGCFLAHRKSWLGFNPYFRKFGGEELYIHDKYRQAGRKAICLPYLRWMHRFGAHGRGIPLDRYAKVRNYVLGALELGKPLDDIYNHFVNQEHYDSILNHLWEEYSIPPHIFKGLPEEEVFNKAKLILANFKISKQEWDWLVEDPIARETTHPDVIAAKLGKKEEPAKPVIPEHGPGTELKEILKSIGIEASQNCSCNRRAAEMNVLGVAGCRAKKDEIVGWLREGAPKWSWTAKLSAAAMSVKTGLAMKVNWLDPFPDLVELAITNAEMKENASKQSTVA